MDGAFRDTYIDAAITAITSHDFATLDKIFKSDTFAPRFGFLDLPLPFSFTYHLERWGEPLIRFGLNSGLYELTVMIVRFIEMLPLIEIVSRNPFRGQIVFNVGDEVGSGHIGFCSKYSDAILVPDVEFIKYDAYRDARRLFALQPSWNDRSDTPFWRGRSTGVRSRGTISSLPRVELCRIGNKLGYDFAISAVAQAMHPAEHQEITDVIGESRPASEFANYRYHIDIDGNTSAWSALFLKLLSGGAVLKVTSPFGFRQWYYNLLLPWINFVPIASDMSDLEEVVRELRMQPDLARRIGENGRRLACALTWDREMAFAERAILAVMMMQE